MKGDIVSHLPIVQTGILCRVETTPSLPILWGISLLPTKIPLIRQSIAWEFWTRMCFIFEKFFFIFWNITKFKMGGGGTSRKFRNILLFSSL